jgi:hypothetical protein
VGRTKPQAGRVCGVDGATVGDRDAGCEAVDCGRMDTCTGAAESGNLQIKQAHIRYTSGIYGSSLIASKTPDRHIATAGEVKANEQKDP